MKQGSKRFVLLSMAMIFAMSIQAVPNIQPTTDPDVVHIPIPKTKVIKRVDDDSEPMFNDFSDKDQVVINRKTHTFYINKINDEVQEAFERESSMMARNGVKEITVNLHSPGGYLFSAYAIVQQMQMLKQRGIKINTIVEKHNACASACPLIFLAGDERTVYSSSVFMFHSPYISFSSKATEDVIRVMLKELVHDRDQYAETLAKTCKNDPDIQMDIYDHKDHFYTAKDLEKRCPNSFFTKIRF